MKKNSNHPHSIIEKSNRDFKKRQKFAIALFRCLRKKYPSGKSMLLYETPVQMLVATMLSAQTTDKKVNEVTAGLFFAKGVRPRPIRLWRRSASGGKKYRTIDDFANANRKTLEREIHSLGFFRQKAKNIIAAAKMLRDEFNGKLPKDINEMVLLPGVARKTANIVLNHVYGIAEGIAVDTHVRQVAKRFGFSKENDPVKIEQDLMKLYPKKYWRYINYVFVDYNRDLHTLIKPECERCFLRKICPQAFR